MKGLYAKLDKLAVGPSFVKPRDLQPETGRVLRVPRKSPEKRPRARVDDKNRLDCKEMRTRLLRSPC